MTAKNLGTGGSSLDARFGDGATSSTFPIHLEHVETDYLYLPGNSRNFATLAPSPSLEIVGDIDVSVRVALDNWTAADQTLIGRGYGNGYWFYTTATNIHFSVVLSGGVIYPGVAWSSRPANGSAVWLRATRVASTGVVTFYSGVDGPNEPSWTLIGTITSTSGNMIYTGSHPVGIGAAAQAGASFAHATGKFYRVIIRNGINGTKVADVDFTTGLESGGQYSIINSSSDKRGIYASTVENLGTGGAQLDAISGTAVDTITNDPLWLGIEESKFVRTPGVAGNYVAVPHSPSLNILGTEDTPFLSLPGPGVGGQYASTPDTAALDITGDIDLRCRAQLTPTVPVTASANLITKGFGSGNYSYFYGVTPGNRLFFEWSSNGSATTTVQSTTTLAVPSGVPYWYRATFDADNGAGGNDVSFYVSSDGITWTQVGTTVTTAGVATMFSSNSFLQLGGYGGSCFTDGRIYRAQVLNGINGTVVFDADFTQQALGSRGFIESTGKLVSLVGNAAQIVDGTTYGFLPGVADASWSAPDSAALSITGDLDLRIRISLNDWTPGTEQPLLAKWTGGSPDISYLLRVSTTGTIQLNWSNDNVTSYNATSSVAPPLSDGQTYWIRATLDVDNGAGGRDIRFFYAADSESEPTAWTQIGTTITQAGVTSIFDGAAILQIGQRAAINAAGRVYRAIIRPNLTSGTKAFDADFTRQLQFASTFTEGSANLATVTTQGAARIERDRDLDLRVKVALDDWTPSATSALVSKALTPLLTDTNRSYYLSVNTTGTLVLAWSTTGVPATQTPATSVAPGLADGSVKWVRVTLDVNNGANGHTVSFYTSDDGSSWTVLGSPIVATGATSIFPGLAPVEVGSLNAGGTQALAGKFYNAEIRNGINGPAVLDLDFSNSITIKNQKYIPDDSFSTIPEAEQFLPNLGTGGTALNARFGSSTAAEPTTSDPLLLTHTGTNYLYAAGGASTNTVTIPDSSALDVLGDVDFRCEVALDTYRPSAITNLFLRGTADPNRYIFTEITTTGTIRLTWYVLGTAASALTRESTAAIPYLGGERTWIRFVLDVDNGAGGHDAIFYISQDGSTWVQLGEVVRTAGTTSLPNVTADMRVWGNTAVGKIYRCQMLNGINGPAVYDVNFTTGITSGAQTTFTESSPNAATVTINRSTSGRKSVAVVQDVLLFGTDDYLEVPDNTLLDFGATDSFTVMSAYRQWGGMTGTLIAKTDSLGATLVGWDQYSSTGTARAQIGDGTRIDAGGPTAASGAIAVVTSIRNTTTDDLTVYLGTTPGTPLADTTTGTLANSQVLRVGRLSGAGTTYADMEWRGSAVWRRALTAAEVALVNTHYTTGPTTESTKLLQEAVWWIDSSIRNVAQINQTNILNPAQAKIDGAYVYTPGTAGNYVAVPHSPSLNILGTEGTPFLSLPGPGFLTQHTETPDQPALDITGDIDVRVDLAADDWSEDSALLSKFGSVGNHSWSFRKVSTGAIRLVWSVNGTTAIVASSDVAVPFADGQRGSVRATLDVDNAGQYQVSFFTSTDFVNWTPLGSVVNGTTGPTSIFNGDRPVRVGADISTFNTGGKFYRAQIRNGINGTVVFDADFTQQALGSRGFIESTGKLVSLVGNAAQIVDGTTFGTVPSGSTVAGWTIPDDNQLDVSDFNAVIRVSLNDWTLASNQALISKYDNTGNQWSYILMIGTNGRPLINYAIGGVLQSGIDWGAGGPSLVDGQTYWFRFSRNSTTGAWRIDYAADSETEPTSWTNVGGDRAGTAGALSNSTASTTIGAFNNAASGYVSVGKFYRAIIRNANTGGSKVLDVDFTRQLQFASTFTEGSSNLFTVTTRGTARIERIRNIELVARVAMDSWIPSASNQIICKDDGTNRSWFVHINTSGYLQAGIYPLGTSTGGIFPGISANIPVSNGETAWIKLTINHSTGYTAVQGFWAPDQPTEPTLWTLLGTNTIAYNSFGLSSSIVSVGSLGNGTSSPLAGKVYRCIVRNGIGGPEILDIDFSDTINTGGEPYIQDTQLEAIPEAEQFLPNLGWGGTALNARFGSAVGADTNDPLLLTHTGTNYLYLPGSSGNSTTTPDFAAMSFNNDMDVRWAGTFTHTGSNIPFIAQDDGVATLRRFTMYASTTNLLGLIWSQDGTAVITKTSTANIPTIPVGQVICLRATLDIDNGAAGNTVEFWFKFASESGAAAALASNTDWTALGSPVITAGTTGLADIAANVRVGSSGALANFPQSIYRAMYLNGINGTVVFDANFTTGITSGAQTTFTESSTNAATVTINRSTSGRKSVAVVQDVLLFGTDDYLEVPDQNLLDFGATDSFTVMAAYRYWNAAQDFYPVSKKLSGALGAGYWLRHFSSFVQLTLDDGAVQAQTSTPAQPPTAQMATIVGVRNTTSDTIQAYTNTTAGTSVTDSTTGSLANANPLTIGRQGVGYADMEWRGSAIWRRALTTTELALVNTHYTTGPTTASLALMQEAVWWIDAGIRSVAQINRSLSGRKTTAVSTDVMLFGTNNYLEVPDNDLLDFGRNDSFTIMTAVRQWPVQVASGRWLDKRGSSGAGYLMAPYSTAQTVYPFISDGTNIAGDFATAPAFSYGSQLVASTVVNRTTQQIVSYSGATPGGTQSTTAVGSLSNSQALRVGSLSSSVSSTQDFEFRSSAIWRRALTSQEIALINTHYTTGPTTASNALLQEAVWWIDAKQSKSGAGISRSTSGLKSVTVTRPTWLVGNGRYFEVSDNNLLDANATQSFSIFAVVRQWPTPTNYGMYVNKVDSAIGDKGYLLGGHETNNALYAAIDDQPTQATRFDQATKPGKLQMVCMVVDRSVQTLRTYVDGVAGTVANIVSVGSLETGVPLRIGRTASGGTALHADVEIVSVGLFRRALTDKEVIDISAYYGASNPINEATVLTGEDGNYLLLENGEPIIIE